MDKKLRGTPVGDVVHSGWIDSCGEKGRAEKRNGQNNASAQNFMGGRGFGPGGLRVGIERLGGH